MMKTLHAMAAVAAALLVASRVTSGLAIMNGSPDFEGHPSVGALVFDLDGSGPIPWAGLCSGSVIARDAFLTAAHCLDEISSPVLRWGVTLEGGAPGDPVILPLSFELDQLPFVRVLKPLTVVTATAVHVHPLFAEGHPRANDLAVLLFPDSTFAGVQPVELPVSGQLDRQWMSGELANRLYTLVGYGAELRQGDGGIGFVVRGYRQIAAAPFQSLTPRWLRLQSTDASTGQGGLCRGDSGSPYLDGLTAMALHSNAGSHVCAGGASTGTRLDTQEAREFLSRFVDWE
jgi:hypothetical protein